MSKGKRDRKRNDVKRLDKIKHFMFEIENCIELLDDATETVDEVRMRLNNLDIKDGPKKLRLP